jgi:acyl-[acyl-carrier-protein]-phospholipid O-acyltransferase/long-chain-fatty-acid--[acyl-carrier-protein] ligase
MLKIFLRLVMKALFRVEVSGDASVFDNPRTLIVANHESFIDGLLIGLFLPIDAVFVVHTQVAKRPLFRFLLRFVNHLAIDSTSPRDRTACGHLPGRPHHPDRLADEGL